MFAIQRIPAESNDQMRFSSLLILLIYSLRITGQCNDPELITDKNINRIASPWQFSFLHNPPQNSLDTLVHQILATNDSTALKTSIRSIGALQTAESKCFLYNCLFRPILIKDLNLFNSIVAKVSYYGGYQVYNTYYLNTEVKPDGYTLAFRQAVSAEALKQESHCYVCFSPENTGNVSTPVNDLQDQQSIDTLKESLKDIEGYKDCNYKYIKRKVKNIIYNNRYPNNEYGYPYYGDALEHIVEEIRKLPCVIDAFTDKCMIKLAIYPGHSNIGVRFKTKEGVKEYCFYVQEGDPRTIGLPRLPLFHYDNNVLVYKGVSECEGFVKTQREKCEQSANNR